MVKSDRIQRKFIIRKVVIFLDVSLFTSCRQRVVDNCSKVIVGKEDAIQLVFTCFLCSGHVLLEDVPGTGKTMLLRAFSKTIGGKFKRIQFTPDLLPSDLTGINFYNQKTGDFQFREGPLFSNIILADEINRATPRTQSSLLEAMEERQISVDGTTTQLEEPFMVMATQNPLENYGTFPLPEAQIDRFMIRLHPGYPDHDQAMIMLRRHAAADFDAHLQPILDLQMLKELQRQAQNVLIHDVLLDYILRLCEATRQHEQILLGISPRGALALVRCSKAMAAIHGRDYVLPDDIKECAIPVLAHRLVLGGLSLGAEFQAETLMQQILDTAAVPTESFRTAS